MGKWQTEKNELKKLKIKLKDLKKDLDNVKLDLERLQPKLKDAKEEWEKFHPQFEEANNNLTTLQSKLKDAEKNLVELKSELDDDEILDLKFIIKKLKKEEIPLAEDEVSNLFKKDEVLRINVDEIEKRIQILQEKKSILEDEIYATEEHIEKIQQDKEYKKDRLFKRLYVEFDEDVLSSIFDYFNIKGNSNEDKLNLLVDIYSEEEVYNLINGKWCENCFTYIPENSEYCPNCGSTKIIIKRKIKN